MSIGAVRFIMDAVVKASKWGETAAVVTFRPDQPPLPKVMTFLRDQGYGVTEHWDEGYIVVDWTFKGEV